MGAVIEFELFRASSITFDSIKQSLRLADQFRSYKRVAITGGGAFKYAEQFKELLGDFETRDEVECIVAGLKFIDSANEGGRVEYPVILANVGTGVSFTRVESDGRFESIGGSSLGGGVLNGLASLFVREGFENVLELAKRGNHQNVDVLVRDIYGQAYEAAGLGEEFVAGALGKIPRYSGRELEADMCAGLHRMLCSNLTQLAHLYASVHTARSVAFSGSFVDNALSEKTLPECLKFWSNGATACHVFSHGGHLACFGAASLIFREQQANGAADFQ